MISTPILRNGIICGLVNALFLVVFGYVGTSKNLNHSQTFAFIGLVSSFVFLFIGVHQKRALAKTWSFGSAFMGGMGIVFIACFFYVVTWQFLYYNYMPDFADKYAEKVIEQLKAKGLTGDTLAKQIADMEQFKINYKDPMYNAGLTFSEIFPVGFLLNIIASLVFMKKK